jgi:hypothetical protein
VLGPAQLWTTRVRLAFCTKVDDIYKAISTVAADVTDNEMHKKIASDLGEPVAPQLQVFIVSSLLGGTGSGMVFDVCYLTRKALSAFDPQLFGDLIIGGTMAADDQKANCYAALMELDHYNRHGFAMQYPGADVRLIEEPGKPLDFVVLLTGINGAGVAFSREAVWESVAESISAETMPGLRDRKQTLRNNILNAGFWLADKIGKPQCYMSAGIASIEFPALNLQDALAYRLAGQAFAHWTFSDAAREDTWRWVDEDLETWKVSGTRLADQILATGAGVPVTREIANQIQDEKREATEDDMLLRGKRKDLLAHVDSQLKEHLKSVEISSNVSNWGVRLKRLHQRAEEIRQQLYGTLLPARIREILGDAHGGGVQNALTYLDSLRDRLKGIAGTYQGRHVRFAEEASAAHEKTNKRRAIFHEEANESTYVVREHALAVMDSSGRYLDMRVQETANALAWMLITGEGASFPSSASLLGVIDTLRRQVETYRSRLNELSEECEKQAATRIASLGASSSLADVLLTDGDADTAFHTLALDLMRSAVELRDRVFPSGQDMFTKILKEPEQARNDLLRCCNERLATVRDRSVAEILAGLESAELGVKFNTLDKHAQALIQLDTSRRAKYANITAPNHVQGRLVGTAPEDREPLLGRLGRLRHALQAHIGATDADFVAALSDRSSLLVAYEMGVFSLQMIKGLGEYRAIYEETKARTPDRPRHVHKSIVFADLFPPSEADIREMARRHVVIGRALGLFRRATDPDIGEEAIYYYDESPHGPPPQRLGSDWPGVEEHLYKVQKDKVIDGSTTGDTLLERIVARIEKRGAQAKRRVDKDRLWTLLETHLAEREAELDGGQLNTVWQQERERIEVFRNKYDLKPPATTSPPFPGLIGGHAEADTLGFRARVAAMVVETGLSGDDRQQLLREASRFGLRFIDAQHIIEAVLDEAANGPSESQSTSPEAARYREELAGLLRDTAGALDPDHLAYLEGLQQDLGLTHDQVVAIEADLMGTGGAP